MAGGSGQRFGARKQFLPLAGSPVAAWAVRAARASNDGVVLVVPAAADPSADGPSAGLPVPGTGPDDAWGADAVVAGGATRAGSVRAGLAAVPAGAAVVVVHDAARPLAAPALFDAVVEAVRAGAAGAVPGVPVADTLKQVAGDHVVATVDREALVAVQTPQAFDAAALRAVHAAGDEATDDAGLLEAAGLAVVVVPGDPRNLKVTRPEDLALAEALLAGAAR